MLGMAREHGVLKKRQSTGRISARATAETAHPEHILLSSRLAPVQLGLMPGFCPCMPNGALQALCINGALQVLCINGALQFLCINDALQLLCISGTLR